MSDTLTGADLEQLDHLAAAYGTAGAEIAGRGQDLKVRIHQAIQRFETTMTSLRADTERANAALSDDIADLNLVATATTWTGNNRAAFDQDLGTLTSSMAASTAAIREGIDDFDTLGVTPFRAMLDDFGLAIADAGDGVEDVGSSMGAAVTQQRGDLQEAADVGWTAV